MASKNKRLGALADIYQAQSLDGAITRIRLSKIRPSAEQPRQNRTLGVDELAESIGRDGLLSPLIVTKEGEGYRIIAGERRYHALTKLGWQEAECRIISREQRDYWRISIIENLQREDLSPEEEATALLRLKKQENLSDDGLAKLVGKSRNYITEILGIAQLPEEVLAECRAAGIDNRNLMIQVVQSFKRNTLSDFLDAYRDGRIRTVRAARAFNRGDEEAVAPDREAPPRNAANKPDPAHSPGQADPLSFSIKGNELLILCESPAAARRLRTWIQKNYPDHKK